MSGCRFGVERERWELPFLAEAEELAGLRRVIRLHLELWGLSSTIYAAQICVTELTSNVIKHVGAGTSACLTVSMNGGCLRIEVSDSGGQRLPTLTRAAGLDEQGRGMQLVEEVAARWGVIVRGTSKTTWCELATGLQSADGHVADEQVAKAEALLGLCGLGERRESAHLKPMSVKEAAEVATGLIADLLLWLRAHGCDADEALDRAQVLFEVESEAEGAA
ncbi:ATP-binding protein [Streptomyces sp. A0642]|uniref:ATP-binding protein n=1 Tax=Streptomyces sp. A0642 TaxID=2563100 RepID=UPI0010A2590D|nr:ATP-binding protein [Streptomyces sp. A0642]THA78540.1 ATP-binding protein [Streptomyces sp. A0642]